MLYDCATMDFDEAYGMLSQPDDHRAVRISPLVSSDKRFVLDHGWYVLRTINTDFQDYDQDYKQLWNGLLTLKYRNNVVSIELASGVSASGAQLAFLIIQSLTSFRFLEGGGPHLVSIDGEVHDDSFAITITYDAEIETSLRNLMIDYCSYRSHELNAMNWIPHCFEGLRRLCELHHP